MGGYGSGTWIRVNRKTTVEECYILDVSRLARDGLLDVGSSGVLSWKNWRTGERLARVGFSVSADDDDERLLCLSYCLGGSEDISTAIRLHATRPNFGGRRWWFECPLIVGGRVCGRRAGKLYLKGRYFGCRHCHDLTYRSWQESHRFDEIKDLLGDVLSRAVRV